MLDPNHGTVREAQVRAIAAKLGVADFVYSAAQVAKGSSQREATGDGLLLIGSEGAVLQVKSRDPARAEQDSEKKAEEWVRKNALKAKDQGLGAKRELARRYSAGEPVTVFPARAAELHPDVRQLYARRVAQDPSDWPVIVVVDHPKCPAVDLGFCAGVVWFTFKDWEELQRRLRSTAGLLRYVERIFEGQVHVPLGCEVERYAPMYQADVESASGMETASPHLTHPTDFDTMGADLFHDVIDHVWQHDGDVPWQSADEYRAMVEFLDAVPPQGQSAIGRWFLQKRLEMAAGQQVASGLHQLHFRDRLVYACSELRHWKTIKSWRAEFMAYVSLRHTQALETGAPEDSKTLGVGVLVKNLTGHGGVSYSFFMLLGSKPLAHVRLSRDRRTWLEWNYGVHNHSRGETIEAIFSLNGPCPCSSGKKYKRCHGRDRVR